jgi:hypothetical protein
MRNYNVSSKSHFLYSQRPAEALHERRVYSGQVFDTRSKVRADVHDRNVPNNLEKSGHE